MENSPATLATTMILPWMAVLDKMYYQLTEIHVIAAMQLAECACWLRSDSTLSPIQASTGQPKPVAMPSMIKLEPSPPTNFSS
jgi:hypothetical protein